MVPSAFFDLTYAQIGLGAGRFMRLCMAGSLNGAEFDSTGKADFFNYWSGLLFRVHLLAGYRIGK